MFSIDTDTRAGRMIQAGRVTVTFTSPTSGQHITLVAKCRAQVDGKWVASDLANAMVVFIEVPNETGWNDKVGKVTRSRGFVADPSADPARVYCAQQLLRFVNGEDMGTLRAQEDTRCGKCGRQLTDPVSIDRGIGPECYGASTGSSHQSKQAAAPAAPAYDPEAARADIVATRARLSAEAMPREAARRARNEVRRTWRETEDAVAEQQGRSKRGERSARHAELIANSSQNRDRPGCDIFGAPLNEES